MAKTIQARAYEKDGIVTVKSVIQHPMETGRRKARKTGKKIPPHFIRELVVSRRGQVVLEAFWGRMVARNPYLSFEFPGARGDEIVLSWLDNRGFSDSLRVRVR